MRRSLLQCDIIDKLLYFFLLPCVCLITQEKQKCATPTRDCNQEIIDNNAK